MTYRCAILKDERGRTLPSLQKNGETISKLAIWRMPMRVGSAEVLMGGIGGVWTHEKHRHKGHASVVMEDACAWMRDNGYDVSILFGIPNFYHRWGFVVTLSSSRVFVPARVAEQCDATCRPRRYRDGDLAAAMAMFNANSASRTASQVRRVPGWVPWRKGVRWGVKPTLFSYMRHGKLVAVAGFDLSAEEVSCVDAAFADESAIAGVVRHAGALAVERRVEKITFWAPPDGALADFCREQGACEMTQNTPRCSGGMARIINQTQCLKKVAPEFARRLRASQFAKWSGKVDVVTNLGATRLVAAKGKVTIAPRKGRADVTLRCPQQRLTQLLFGFQSIDFMLAHKFARVSGSAFAKATAGRKPVARDILATLFPRSTAYVAVPDHF